MIKTKNRIQIKTLKDYKGEIIKQLLNKEKP